MHKRLELIGKSLPIFEKIGELQESGCLEPERAAILKQSVEKGIEKFLVSGAITPAMEQESTFSPKALARAEPKLLTVHKPDVGSENKTEEPSVDVTETDDSSDSTSSPNEADEFDSGYDQTFE